MAQKGRSKGVSYYFKLEFSTLQGKITSGFCLLAVLASMMMAISAWILYPALERSQYITNILDASNHQLLLVSATTERAVAMASVRVLGRGSYTTDDLASSKKAIELPLQSLGTLSKGWQSTEATLALKLMEVKALSLEKTLKELTATASPDQQAHLVNNELLPTQKVIHDQVKTIQRLHKAEKKQIQAFIEYRSDNILWILLACLVLSTLLGSVFATYVVMQVLQQIRMLRNKILELSEGKLIEPIAPSKNELNSIIKAINTLTENFHTIRHFAQEVGKGNFDTNIAVFNNENDLGEALAGMRESLKNVAEEEKQRSWVSSGLAHFSELLRATNDNLTTYYQSIISELVKQLNINQAALYILEEPEGGKAVLEMKASYAFDRLKYQQKTLEPGQGLVGQVFLEKKPLFLKNIPATFMHISSGLGEASPRYLNIIPLQVNGSVNGVLELASFQELAPYQTEFLLKIAENISSALHNVNNVQTTSRLLEEAQQMAHAMQAQEEMLRQNSEELFATQEQLSRDLQETNQKVALLEGILDHSPVAQLLITQTGTIQEVNKKANDYFGEPVEGRHVSSLWNAPELLRWMEQAQEQATATLELPNPGKGVLQVHLKAISIKEHPYFIVLVNPQESFSAA
jgi:PAS domain-containing protein